MLVGWLTHLIGAVRTPCALLGLLRPLRFPDDRLDLLPIFLVNIFPVLRPHQGGGVREGGVLEAGPVALYDGGGEDGDDVTGELADVGRHPEQHPGRGEMIASPHVEPCQRVAVQDHQVVSHLPGDRDPVPAQLLTGYRIIRG